MKLFKASACGGETIPSVKIIINTEISEDLSPGELMSFFSEQGKALVNLFYQSLPGGTIDAIFCELMERKRSSLIVKTPF